MEQVYETASPTSEATQARTRLGYVPELDGVRGIAILFVIGNHLPFRRFGSLLPGGFAGVDIFFVLSGFLITTLLVQEFNRTGSISLRSFYIRRALRLGPALLAMLAIFCLLSFVLYDKAQAKGNCLNALIALSYASNWVRIFSKNQLGLLAHTWSLSAEEQFYLLWPLILLTLLRFGRKRSYVVLVATGIALLSWMVSIYLAFHLKAVPRLGLHLCFGLDSRAEPLMLGCIIGVALSSGMLTESRTQILRKFLRVVAPASLLLLLGFAYFSYLVERGFFFVGFVILALLAGCLVLEATVSSGGVVKRILGMKWLVWVGSVSYGLYLWHWPILFGMHRFGYSAWTVLLVGLPLTFAAVVPSYYFLEQPMLRLKGRFTREIGASQELSLGRQISSRA
jgi:peptidoglycan/LPS O-acetylase OafA/YrhL